jgi:hypothetical protein
MMIPASPRGATLAGLALYAPCRRRGVLLQHAARTYVRMFSGRLLPGRPVSWSPPVEDPVWRELRDTWVRAVGSFDRVATYEQPQEIFHGIALLLLDGASPRGFVKLRSVEPERLEREQELLRYAAGTELSFAVPEVIDGGQVDGWRYLMMAPLPPRPHRPAVDISLDEVVADVQRLVAAVLPRGEAPTRWEPMHGDLAPWNLREVSGRGLMLLDWEEAGWGPPGADAVLYPAAAAALSGATPTERSYELEAVRFWEDRLVAKRGEPLGQHFGRMFARSLSHMRSQM